jgi:hypothetical protein
MVTTHVIIRSSDVYCTVRRETLKLKHLVYLRRPAINLFLILDLRRHVTAHGY